MKSEVLKRSMFAMPLTKAARNSGIMEGFEDELEAPDDIETKGAEEMPPMARTPQNPEILMNTLRGDMRSTDARYQELAELVGDAAYETPPEVLAMLQPMLAQFPQGGIAGLGQMPPEMASMMQPQEAPQMAAGPLPAAPEAMPQMPPSDQGGIASLPMPPDMAPAAPEQFADGGIVQRFSDGSDEEGVTPSNEIYPPEVVEAARQWVASQAGSTATPVPTLAASMQKRLPMYQELLGTARSKDDMQTQMLLDIAGRGLAFAGNVDEQGRPLRGSFASKLGQVTRTLPTTLSGMLAEQRKAEMGAKQLALQAAEKDIQEIRDANAKDIESKRRLFTDVLKAEAKARGQENESIFGKGAWEWRVINRPGFIAQWAAGKTTEDQDNLIASAIEKLSAPRTELRQQNNPVTNQPETVTIQVPGTLPSFVREAQAARSKLLGIPMPQAQPAAGGPQNLRGAGPGAPAGGGAPTAAGTVLQEGPAPLRAAPVVYDSSVPNMFNLAAKGTGPVAITSTVVARIPILGNFFETDKEVQANTFLENSVNQLNRSIATNPRFSEGERQSINKELELMPRLIERPEAYRQRLVALDSLMLQLRDKAYREGYLNRELGPDTIRRGREKVDEIDSIRKLLGVPPRVTSKKDFDALPAGSAYILRQGGVDKMYMKE